MNRRTLFGPLIRSHVPPLLGAGREVCVFNQHMHQWTDEDEANLNLIVKAANLHDELVAMLREMHTHYSAVAAGPGTNDLMHRVEALLAKADAS